jgi:hypothetical protein
MTQMITLTYEENGEHKAYEMSIENCMKSNVMKDIIDCIELDNNEIPLLEQNINTTTLKLLDEYLTYHVQNPKITSKPHKPLIGTTLSENGICEFDITFTDKLDQATLYSMVMIANYLYIPELIDLMCAIIAFKLKNAKNEEEIKKLLEV